MDYFTGKALEYEVLDDDEDDFEDLDDDEDDEGQFDDVSREGRISVEYPLNDNARIPNRMSKSPLVAADHQKVAEVHPRGPP